MIYILSWTTKKHQNILFRPLHSELKKIQRLFKDLHINLRTFQGLPLKFKDFSRLCKPCVYIWVTHLHIAVPTIICSLCYAQSTSYKGITQKGVTLRGITQRGVTLWGITQKANNRKTNTKSHHAKRHNAEYVPKHLRTELPLSAFCEMPFYSMFCLQVISSASELESDSTSTWQRGHRGKRWQEGWGGN